MILCSSHLYSFRCTLLLYAQSLSKNSSSVEVISTLSCFLKINSSQSNRFCILFVMQIEIVEMTRSWNIFDLTNSSMERSHWQKFSFFFCVIQMVWMPKTLSSLICAMFDLINFPLFFYFMKLITFCRWMQMNKKHANHLLT